MVHRISHWYSCHSLRKLRQVPGLQFVLGEMGTRSRFLALRSQLLIKCQHILLDCVRTHRPIRIAHLRPCHDTAVGSLAVKVRQTTQCLCNIRLSSALSHIVPHLFVVSGCIDVRDMGSVEIGPLAASHRCWWWR